MIDPNQNQNQNQNQNINNHGGHSIHGAWQIDKSLSLGHLLTTVAMVASAFAAFYSLSARLAVVEDKVLTILGNQAQRDESQDSTLDQFRLDMRDRSADINTKLDTITAHLLP